jgi:hypothetical protein
MYAVEFQAKVKNGSIEIPRNTGLASKSESE